MSITPRSESAVPALAPTPASEITAEDIEIPRIYIGQGLSEAVQAGTVKPGDIYSAYGADDDDPEPLTQPVRVHPVHFFKSLTDQTDNQFKFYAWGDPNAPETADVNYNFTFCLPEVDAQLPYRMSFKRSSAGTGRKILSVLSRNATAGPAWVNAFELSSSQKTSDKGGHRFYVAQIKTVEARESDVEAAAALGEVVQRGQRQQARTPTNQPEI